MKKELIKNGIHVGLILLLAIISTYYIYNKFQNDRETDFNSESLDVIYHDQTKDLIDITKVIPVTDSVGLSSNAYSLTIKNNLTIGVNYTVKIVDNLDKIKEDECGESSIPKDNIRISVKAGKDKTMIYTLSELEDGVLCSHVIGALGKENVVIRTWIDKDTTLVSGSNMHYHGKIQIIENNSIIAINK